MGIIKNLEILENNFFTVNMVYNSNSKDEKHLLLLLDELDKIERGFKSANSHFIDKTYLNNKIKEVQDLIANIETTIKCLNSD